MMKKPFIKLFRTPNSWYFYDVPKSELCQIQTDSYLFLQRLLHDGSTDSEPPDELVHLAQMGYLTSESPVKELRHPYSRYLPQFLDRNLRQLILQVTQSCNFRCKYCIYSETSSARQRHHSAKHMSWDMAKKAVDFLWEHSIDSRVVSISFYGGEPLLQFPLVQKVIQYSRARFVGKKLTFNMTTNGTLLTDVYPMRQKGRYRGGAALRCPKAEVLSGSEGHCVPRNPELPADAGDLSILPCAGSRGRRQGGG